MRRIAKRILLSLILCLCLALSLSFLSCQKDGEDTPEGSEPVASTDGLTLFDGGAYTAKVVYASEGVTPSLELRTALSNALSGALGASPETVRDADEADTGEVEILLGSTDRSESTPSFDTEAEDAWYFVGIVGNRLVINGSSDYMLELAVDAFISDILGESDASRLTVLPEMTERVIWKDYTTEDWRFDRLPYYKGARVRYSMVTYDAGTLLTDIGDSRAESVQALAVTRTTSGEFAAYVERLVGFGFQKLSEKVVEGNTYVTLSNGTDRVYTYYVGAKNTANVIIDNVSASPEEISTPMTAEASKGAEFYMYGLNMDPYLVDESGVAGYPNNGMLFIIKCADNSVIIIDGGDTVQMSGIADESVKPMEKLNAFLHEITGTPDGERVTIGCWYLTHLHSDHFGGFREFITNYYGQYDLRSICANIPTKCENISSQVSTVSSFASFLSTKYPECKEIKIHTGQSIQIADVTLQALYTHEDAFGASTGKLVIDDANNTTTVMKVSTGDMSMLVLGDALDMCEDFLLTAYSAETLKCDMVQVAHHALNGLTKIYDTVQPDIYLVPQSYGMYLRREEVWEVPLKQKLDELFESSVVYFSGKFEYTVGLAVRDGAIAVIYTPAELPDMTPEDILPPPDISAKEDEDTRWGELNRVNR